MLSVQGTLLKTCPHRPPNIIATFSRLGACLDGNGCRIYFTGSIFKAKYLDGKNIVTGVGHMSGVEILRTWPGLSKKSAGQPASIAQIMQHQQKCHAACWGGMCWQVSNPAAQWRSSVQSLSLALQILFILDHMVGWVFAEVTGMHVQGKEYYLFLCSSLLTIMQQYLQKLAQ